MSGKIEEIREIVKRIPELKQDLEYLRNSRHPLVLFGIGEAASATKFMLDKNGTGISYVVVDMQFRNLHLSFHGLPVISFEDLLKKEKEFDLIVTFSLESLEKTSERIEESRKTGQIKKYLVIDYDRAFLDFVNDHHADFEELFLGLQGDLSRDILLEYIKAKGLISSPRLMELHVPGEEHYFPDFLRLDENETFVDCGAFDGDTALRFIKHAKENFNRIYAFEPNEKYAQKFLDNTGKYKDKIDFHKKGTWSKAGELYFVNEEGGGSHIENQRGRELFPLAQRSTTLIALDSVDNVVKNEPVSFIKMDIEGAELEALRGAENTIRRYKPKLAICVYHKQEDLVTIPQYILSIHNDYKLYLRHYGTKATEEFVLYAV
jgi:FkbM family methyltransferase